MPYPAVDPAALTAFPIAERKNYLRIEDIAVRPDRISAPEPQCVPDHLIDSMRKAKTANASRMMTYGAHLIKNGAGPLVNALVERGFLTHIATQGAGVIHDWEFAFQGESSESVRDNAPVGRFGTWDETGRWINLAIVAGAADGMGIGESVGLFIEEDGITLPDPEALTQRIIENPDAIETPAIADLVVYMRKHSLAGGRIDVAHPYKQYSVLACAYRNQVPLTIHPGIGYDIINTHPMYLGAAIGRAAAIDYYIFCQSILELSGGIYWSVGSAIMSPQVFEKAFSCANNLLIESGQQVTDFDIAIVDLQDGGDWDWRTGEPPMDHPAYYLRFCKSFYRMGGRVSYLCADNRDVLLDLSSRLNKH